MALTSNDHYLLTGSKDLWLKVWSFVEEAPPEGKPENEAERLDVSNEDGNNS